MGIPICYRRSRWLIPESGIEKAQKRRSETEIEAQAPSFGRSQRLTNGAMRAADDAAWQAAAI